MEFDDHYDAWYGTKKHDVALALQKNDIAFLVSDPNGTRTLQRLYPDATFVAIRAEMEDVKKFLLARGDSTEKIASRLASAHSSWSTYKTIYFDLVIQNTFGKFGETLGGFAFWVAYFEKVKGATKARA